MVGIGQLPIMRLTTGRWIAEDRAPHLSSTPRTSRTMCYSYAELAEPGLEPGTFCSVGQSSTDWAIPGHPWNTLYITPNSYLWDVGAAPLLVPFSFTSATLLSLFWLAETRHLTVFSVRFIRGHCTVVMSATDSANAKHGSGHMTLSNDNPRCSLTQDIPLLLGVECLIHKLYGNGRKTVNPE